MLFKFTIDKKIHTSPILVTPEHIIASDYVVLTKVGTYAYYIKVQDFLCNVLTKMGMRLCVVQAICTEKNHKIQRKYNEEDIVQNDEIKTM